jgi:hypothetical protein
MEQTKYIIHECSREDCIIPGSGSGEEAERTSWTGMYISGAGMKTLTRGRVSNQCPECGAEGVRAD